MLMRLPNPAGAFVFLTRNRVIGLRVDLLLLPLSQAMVLGSVNSPTAPRQALVR